MAVVNYQRIVDGTTLSGKFGESLQATERWQLRVDTPTTTKSSMLTWIANTAGVKWGAAHFEFPALKAMEFDLSPEGKDGMRWILTVRYYIPPANKTPKTNGVPEDVWERSGGTTTIPAFTDKDGVTICNAAGDPLEGLEEEREEASWSLTKYYTSSSTLETDIAAYAGRVNSATWASGAAKTWKCYFKGAKKQSVSKLDGSDDAGTLSFIESRWEFRYDSGTWKLMPWDVGFMELVSGQRQTIVGSDGKAVKQPVALNSNGTKKTAGQKPDVVNGGAGVDVYSTANWSTALGTPTLI